MNTQYLNLIAVNILLCLLLLLLFLLLFFFLLGYFKVNYRQHDFFTSHWLLISLENKDIFLYDHKIIVKHNRFNKNFQRCVTFLVWVPTN